MSTRNEFDAAITASRRAVKINKDLLGRIFKPTITTSTGAPAKASPPSYDHTPEWQEIERENRIRDARNAARNDEVEP